MSEETWKCDKCGGPAMTRISGPERTITICSKCMKLAVKKLEKMNRRRR